jgi:hypothetical protein
MLVALLGAGILAVMSAAALLESAGALHAHDFEPLERAA